MHFFSSSPSRPRCPDDASQKQFSWFSDWIPKVQTFVHLVNFQFRFFSPKRRISVHLVDLVKSFQTSIQYLLAKFGVDTAENEPLKVCQKLANSYLKKVRKKRIGLAPRGCPRPTLKPEGRPRLKPEPKPEPKRSWRARSPRSGAVVKCSGPRSGYQSDTYEPRADVQFVIFSPISMTVP